MTNIAQLKTKIKAIEEIRRISEAMCSVAMSSYTQIQPKIKKVHGLEKHLVQLRQKVTPYVTTSAPHTKAIGAKNDFFRPTLLIVNFANQGLCSNFDQQLLEFLKNNISYNNSYEVIALGKKAEKFVSSTLNKYKILFTYKKTSLSSLHEIRTKIISTLYNNPDYYKEAFIISNVFKSILIQEPTKTELPQAATPFLAAAKDNNSQDLDRNLTFEQPVTQIYEFLNRKLLEIKVEKTILNSLLSESSKRFKTMDEAGKNAVKLLEGLRLTLNKERQDKITKEINEICSSFLI